MPARDIVSVTFPAAGDFGPEAVLLTDGRAREGRSDKFKVFGNGKVE
jgi:hypothetical protein